ncbi:glycosyltransferase family 2 protein [Bariatricus sp. SGI.019]|uniref:glycosyltransferase family 2 protein n=1 Tax=Bariatricus sp. SGI.019 TaxID=3420548 RepID=UPI003CFE561D
MKKSDLLIIIPAYNEEENIENVVNFIQENYSQYDYIVVNDGSIDRTAEICREKGYELLNLPVNLGLAGAFQAGLKYAYEKDYSFAIQFDADGQHLPEFIEPMLKRIREGYDIVIGSRFVRKRKNNSLRMIGSKVLTVAIKMTTKVRISDPTSGMRMFSKPMIKEFAKNLNYGPEPDTVSYLLKNGAKVSEIQVEMEERQYGQSYLNWISSAKYMIKMLISIFFVQNFRKRDN